MKKIMFGLVAALALTAFAAPSFAQDAPAGDAAPAKKDKKAKKDKGDKKAPDAAGADAAKK